MAKLKAGLFGLAAGLLCGLWAGVNIGKGQPWYANPFTGSPIQSELRNAGRDLVRESGEGLEQVGERLKQEADKASKH